MKQATSLAVVPHKTIGRHGELRGLESRGRSDQFEGRFGRMFLTLPAAQFDAGILHDLAAVMTAEFGAQQTPETEVDDEENMGISADYTYLGQFIDHSYVRQNPNFTPIKQLLSEKWGIQDDGLAAPGSPSLRG
jgi:hypothetical protein